MQTTPPHRALFISFEGGDGSGKSTQIDRLATHFESLGKKVCRTLEPGGTSLGGSLRELLLKDSSTPLAPEAELFLMLASRAQHVREVLQPALDTQDIILCDRYADSSWVYQGHGRGLSLDLIERANGLATGGLSPDLTLVFDVDPQLGLERSMSRMSKDQAPEARFEGLDLEFHQRVRDGYKALLARFPRRCRRIDASASADDVTQEILGLLAEEGPFECPKKKES